MSIRIEFDDHASVNFFESEMEPDDRLVFATLTEAKSRALAAAVPNRDAWARCVRNIRTLTKDQVIPL